MSLVCLGKLGHQARAFLVSLDFRDQREKEERLDLKESREDLGILDCEASLEQHRILNVP